MHNITTLIISITAFITALTGLALALRKFQKEAKETVENLKSMNDINIEIVNRMEFLKEYLDADRIQIYDFHNGEHYKNGRSAMKVSCTFEVVRAKTKRCHMDLQSIPISCIPKFINALLSEEEMNVCDIEEIKDTMPATYNLKKSEEIKSFYDIVINNKENEPVAFLGIQYTRNKHDKFSEDEKNEILKMKFFIEENFEKMKSKKKKRGK